MNIRDATQQDANCIAEIHISSWQQNYANALTANYLKNVAPAERHTLWNERLTAPSPNQHVFVAQTSGDIIGFACVYYNQNPKWGAYLDNLHVVARYQAKGVGKQLLCAVASGCLQHASDTLSGLCLLVNRNNTRAQDFYLHLGARNAEESIWHAPDGSAVPTYWFVWDSVATLIA